MKSIVPIALSAAALAGCTAPYETAPPMGAGPMAAGAPRQCFYTSDVNGFRGVDNRTVNLATARGEFWQVRTVTACGEARYADSIAVRNRTGGDRVCTGLDADLVVPRTPTPKTCPAASVRQLSPVEVAALSPAHRP